MKTKKKALQFYKSIEIQSKFTKCKALQVGPLFGSVLSTHKCITPALPLVGFTKEDSPSRLGTPPLRMLP